MLLSRTCFWIAVKCRCFISLSDAPCLLAALGLSALGYDLADAPCLVAHRGTRSRKMRRDTCTGLHRRFWRPIAKTLNGAPNPRFLGRKTKSRL